MLFDRSWCGGEELMISHDHYSKCLRDLEHCHWHAKVSSVSFCSVAPGTKEKKVGYSGERCASSCFWRGKPYFWCYLETGGRDYCYPQPGYDTNGKKCKGNCSINGFDVLKSETSGDPTAVVLYMGRYFQGKKLAISWVNKNQCFNLGYNDESATNFNKMVHSVELKPPNSACLLLYNSTGCTGESLLVAGWHNESCLKSLDNCNWAFKVSSLSSCEAQSRKSNNSRISPTNSGTTQTNSLRASLYVRPEFRDDHITIDGTGTTKCFTLGYDAELAINFNEALMSIALDNGACLHLYDRIGCLGTPVEVSLERNPKCLWNLEACGMHRKVSSLSFCGTTFPSVYRLPTGVQGNPCSGPCEDGKVGHDLLSTPSTERFGGSGQAVPTLPIGLWNTLLREGMPTKRPLSVQISRWNWTQIPDNSNHDDLQLETNAGLSHRVKTRMLDIQEMPLTYFRCDTNRSWDFCSPRPGVNYFGEDLKANVFYEETAILYDQAKFNGHGAALKNSKNKLCHNLQEGGSENFRRRLASVDLKQSCLQIYEGIGCSGDSLEIVAQDVDNCHVDLRACGWHNRVLSIRFCSAPWPTKYTQPNGSRGDTCKDDCDTRGKTYFWCHVQNGRSDYCLPRPGQDLFGNDCEEDCLNLSNLDPVEASSSPRKHPTNMFLSLSLLVAILWFYY